jgi:Flp pilus assembly secretin CpaC
MTRRKLFLLSGLLAACAISLGFIVPPFLPSPVQAEVDQLRSSLELRYDEPGAEPLAVNESKQVLIAFHVYGFDATNARTTILADGGGQAVCGVAKGNARFQTALKDLRTKGYLDVYSMPQLMALDGQTAYISIGQNMGPQWRGVKFEARPALRGDRRIELAIDLKMDDGPPARSELFNLKSTVVVEDGQTCFFGGPTRKATRSIPWIPKTGDWPIFGSWRLDVEYDEEIFIAATVRSVTTREETEKWLDDMSRSAP